MSKKAMLLTGFVILVSMFAIVMLVDTNIAMAVNDNPGPTNYPGNGAPWAQPPKNGMTANDNPGPTNYPGNGAPWAQPPKNGMSANDNPGPTNFPGNGAPWAQPPKGKA